MKTDELYTHMHDAVDDAVRLGNPPAIGMADALAMVVVADAMPHLFEMLDMMREQAERQAAAMERANEIATSALDPWGAIEGLKMEAETKDAEIARLNELVGHMTLVNVAAGNQIIKLQDDLRAYLDADDQRAEDEQGYNAEVAKVAEFNKRWGFEK